VKDSSSAVTGAWFLRRRKPEVPPEPQPVCGCRHHYCMHSPETGKCNVIVAIATYDTSGKRAGQSPAVCPCVHYVGPEPLPVIYAPPPAA
jgi:hypothetical protein